jgi:predicted ABC-class ATPase
LERLRATLKRIDRRSFKAYEDIVGHYRGSVFRLLIDHVQPDPFAPPTRLRVRLDARQAAFPPHLAKRPGHRLAVADLLARRLREALGLGETAPSHAGRGGFSIVAGRQTVIPRTAVTLDEQGSVEARLSIGLPAEGRRIRGGDAALLLCDRLPSAIEEALLARAIPFEQLDACVRLHHDQEAIRAALDSTGIIAFVANGAILPRQSGVDDHPLSSGAVPFRSPPALEVEIALPGGRRVRGMGIRRGVTLITGGGYHGKSTLLSALARGIYDHIGGDGRELVVTVADAVKVRAESGRCVAGVDLRPFLGPLPGGRDTADFSTQNASGSTSQAASILEALEMGARVLLLDEDTCATNFMVRDARMQALIPGELEPIVPFVDKVRPLYTGRGVSAVLVTGGSGDYLDVADCVIRMDHYVPEDVTARARAVAAAIPTGRAVIGGERFGEVTPRCPDPASLRAGKGRREVRVDVRGERTLVFGLDAIDLSAAEQIEEPAQVRAIGWAMHLLAAKHLGAGIPLRQGVETAMEEIRRRGLDVLTPFPAGDLALPRPLELAAAVNRLRRLRVRQAPCAPPGPK